MFPLHSFDASSKSRTYLQKYLLDIVNVFHSSVPAQGVKTTKIFEYVCNKKCNTTQEQGSNHALTTKYWMMPATTKYTQPNCQTAKPWLDYHLLSMSTHIGSNGATYVRYVIYANIYFHSSMCLPQYQTTQTTSKHTLQPWLV